MGQGLSAAPQGNRLHLKGLSITQSTSSPTFLILHLYPFGIASSVHSSVLPSVSIVDCSPSAKCYRRRSNLPDFGFSSVMWRLRNLQALRNQSSLQLHFSKRNSSEIPDLAKSSRLVSTLLLYVHTLVADLFTALCWQSIFGGQNGDSLVIPSRSISLPSPRTGVQSTIFEYV